MSAVWQRCAAPAMSSASMPIIAEGLSTGAQPVLDTRVGQYITGIMRVAGGIEWSFGRKQGLGL
jgi:hypothetical protein